MSSHPKGLAGWEVWLSEAWSWNAWAKNCIKHL